MQPGGTQTKGLSPGDFLLLLDLSFFIFYDAHFVGTGKTMKGFILLKKRSSFVSTCRTGALSGTCTGNQFRDHCGSGGQMADESLTQNEGFACLHTLLLLRLFLHSFKKVWNSGSVQALRWAQGDAIRPKPRSLPSRGS